MTLWGGVIISLIATFIGITVSYHFTLPTGPAIIMVFTTFLVVAYIIRIIIAKRRLKDAPNARS